MARARWAAALAAVALGAGGAGCGGDLLEGSVGENLSLEFDEVQVALQGGQFLIVEFVSGIDEEVAEVTIDILVPGCEIEAGRELDFVTCAFLDRTMADATEFDTVASGRVVIFRWGDIGDRIEGEFDVRFDNGLTLSGEFSATLVERNG